MKSFSVGSLSWDSKRHWRLVWHRRRHGGRTCHPTELQQQQKPQGKQVGNLLLCLMQLLRLLHSMNWSAGMISPLNSHPVYNSYKRKDNEIWTGDVILVNEDEYSLTRRLLVKSMYIQCIFVALRKGGKYFLVSILSILMYLYLKYNSTI
jgi:hypothetical protein